MPVLKLCFGDSVLKEVPMGMDPATIGRNPKGDIFIDNPAVSFHHARVICHSGVYYVEDLGSLNGTFLNGARVTQAPLTHGDIITVGKHSVRYSLDPPGVKVQPRAKPREEEEEGAKLTGTMVLDTKHRRDLQEAFAKGQTAIASSTAVAKVGKLTVLKGKTTEKEYLLTSNTAMVGKNEQCTIRLKGWFAPKIAAMITKAGEIYHLSPATARKVSVNGTILTAKIQLQEGDLVAVGKVLMQFNLVAW